MTKNQSKQRPISPSFLETIWYVGFTDCTGPVRWWNIFTQKNFRHIYLYAEVGKHVVIFTMTRGGLVTTMMEITTEVNVHKYLMGLYEAHLVLPARGLVSPTVSIPRLAPFTCVELARSLLGIDKMLWTPWQLYKHLIKHRIAGSPLMP